MKFNAFLENYYLNSQSKELIALLKQLSILKPVTAIIEQFYTESPETDPEGFNTHLILTISDFVSTANKALALLSKNTTKQDAQATIANLGLCLIKETYQTSKYKKQRYFKLLRTTLQKVYKTNQWNFNELDNLLQLDKIELFATDTQAPPKSNSIKTNETYFEWCGTKSIDLFYHDVKDYFKLKNISNLYFLFQPMGGEYAIEIKATQLIDFLLLFQQLHTTKTIAIKNSRGIYKLLQHHLKPLKGTFPLKDFRKYKYDYKQKGTDYIIIETSINKAFSKYYTTGTIGR